ncbi:hypothetical protein SAURM35S_02021 [Streptomyces aurantiogriseus]
MSGDSRWAAGRSRTRSGGPSRLHCLRGVLLRLAEAGQRECAREGEREPGRREGRESVAGGVAGPTPPMTRGDRTGDGESFEGPFALRLTVEDGRITRHHLYENSLSIPRPHP